MPTIADGPATDTCSVPLQVVIIVEPKQEKTLQECSYELVYLVAVCTVIGGFLWVMSWTLRGFAARVVHF